MRIAVVTSSYPRFAGDGTAPFVRSITEMLFRFGHEVEVVVPYDPQVQPGKKNRIPVHRFRYAPIRKWHIMGHGQALDSDVRLKPLSILLLPFFLMAELITLWKVTGQQKTQVIHAHWVLPNGPAAALVARLRRIPLVISLHGSDIYLASKNRWFGWMAGWVFRQASGVTACSPELKERAIKLGAKPDKVELIAWGADPDIFQNSNDRKKLRTKLGWSNGVVIIGLGRLVYKKGFDILLKAWSEVFTDYPEARVVIGGDGPIFGELRQLSQSLGLTGSVGFLGRVPWNDVPALFAAADIFALPSVRDASGNLDGLPTVLLEAMSCGAAIIASDIGGVSLAIRDHGNGIMVTPGSVTEYAQALRSLLESPTLCAELGKAARKTVVDELNWDKVTHRIEKILLQSVSKK